MTVKAHPQIQKLAARLFADASEQEAFLRSIVEPIDLPPTIIDLAEKPLPFETIEELPGQPAIAKRLQLSSHPTRHPLHDEGAFYSLDYSSVFAASVILATPKNPDVILDVCAAPGGKSVFAWKALRPQVLLSNEIVQGRAKALISNLKRCHVTPVRVFSAGPDQLALRLPQACDLVLLDVPCSGQSLMVKGQTVTGSFMPHAVSGNVKRQRRILAQASECVKPGGYIAYMTCTFAPEENEKNIEWFLRKFPEFEAVKAPHLESYQSHLADFPCYRIWPHRVPSAGAFTALLKSKKEAAASFVDVDDLTPIWKS